MHTAPTSLAPSTRKALGALGYELVDVGPAHASRGEPAGAFDAQLVDPQLVDVQLVDAECVDAAAPGAPLVVLGAARAIAARERRPDVAFVRRPAALADLFPVLQTLLEREPRRAPRAPVRFPFRGVHGDRRFVGRVVELSATGCLVELDPAAARPALLEGERLNLEIALPDRVAVRARAECRRVAPGLAGLAFRDVAPTARADIARFVARALAG